MYPPVIGLYKQSRSRPRRGSLVNEPVADDIITFPAPIGRMCAATRSVCYQKDLQSPLVLTYFFSAVEGIPKQCPQCNVTTNTCIHSGLLSLNSHFTVSVMVLTNRLAWLQSARLGGPQHNGLYEHIIFEVILSKLFRQGLREVGVSISKDKRYKSCNSKLHI